MRCVNDWALELLVVDFVTFGWRQASCSSLFFGSGANHHLLHIYYITTKEIKILLSSSPLINCSQNTTYTLSIYISSFCLQQPSWLMSLFLQIGGQSKTARRIRPLTQWPKSTDLKGCCQRWRPSPAG